MESYLNPSLQLQFIVVGASGTGKTSIIRRFIEKQFVENISPTLRYQNFTNKTTLDGQTVNLMIYDTPGQEKFYIEPKACFSGAQAVILLFDITNRISFNELPHWLHDIRAQCNKVMIVLVGNKADMTSSRQVSQIEAEAFAKVNGINYMETSAAQDIAVEKVFIQIAQNLLRKILTKGKFSSPIDQYDLSIIEAIEQKSEAALRKCKIGINDVNRPLFPHIELNPNQKVCSLPLRGPTPLIYAVVCNAPSCVQYMLKVCQPDLLLRCNGWTALHFAAANEDTQCLELLLHEPQIQEHLDCPVIALSWCDSVSPQTTNALHIAVTHKCYRAALLLIFPPALQNDLNSFDPSGMGLLNSQATSGSTPLHIAAYMNDAKMVRLLLSAGANPNITNRHNETPKQYAERLGRVELAASFDQKPTILELCTFKVEFQIQLEGIPSPPDILPFSEKSETPNGVVPVSHNFREIEVQREKIANLEQEVRELKQMLLQQQKSHFTHTEDIPIQHCTGCASLNILQCPNCQKFFCEKCMRKRKVHDCLN